MKLSVRSQTVIGIGVIEVVMLVVLLVSIFNFIQSSSTDEISRRADSIAQLFAATTADAVLSLDLGTLNAFVEEAAATPGTVFVRVIDRRGGLLAEAGQKSALLRPFEESDKLEPDQLLFMSKAEINRAGQIYGAVEIGLDLERINSGIAEIKVQSMVVAALEIVLASAFSLAFGHYLTRRFQRIATASRRLAEGDYSVSINDRQLDEVADVSGSLDYLAKNLAWQERRDRKRIVELEELIAILERKVNGSERP